LVWNGLVAQPGQSTGLLRLPGNLRNMDSWWSSKSERFWDQRNL